MQIIQRTLSDLEYVVSLTGPTRDVVLAAYVRSFEYAHGKRPVSSLFLATWVLMVTVASLICSLLALLVAFAMRVHDLG